MNKHPASTPTIPATVTAAGSPGAWRSVDLITLAVLGVAFGVVFWGFSNLVYGPLEIALAGFPPAKELMLGVWLLPAVVGALIVRRPGAALLCELTAAAVEMLLGQQWGPTVMISGLLQGLGVELVVALVRWRRFGPMVAAASGALSAVLAIVVFEWWFYVQAYSPAWKLIYLSFGVISGVVVAGLGGHALVRALSASGALDAFPAGQERWQDSDEVTDAAAPRH